MAGQELTDNGEPQLREKTVPEKNLALSDGKETSWRRGSA